MVVDGLSVLLEEKVPIPPGEIDDEIPAIDDIDVAVDGSEPKPDGAIDVPAIGDETLDVSGDVPVESDVPPVSVAVLPNELLPRLVDIVDPERIDTSVTPSVVFDAPTLDRLEAAVVEPVTPELEEKLGLENPRFDDAAAGTHRPWPVGAETVGPGTAGLVAAGLGTVGLVWPVGFVGSGGVVCICAASTAEAHARLTQLNTAVFIAPFLCSFRSFCSP